MKAAQYLFALAFFSALGAGLPGLAAALPARWNTPAAGDGAWIQNFENDQGTASVGYTGGNAAFFGSGTKGRTITSESPYQEIWQDAPYANGTVYMQFAMQNVAYVGSDPEEVDKLFFVVEDVGAGNTVLAAKYWTGSEIRSQGETLSLAGIEPEAWFTVTLRMTEASLVATVGDSFAATATIPLLAGGAIPRGVKVTGDGLVDNILASYGDPLRGTLYTPPPAPEGVTLDSAVQAHIETALQNTMGATSVSMTSEGGVSATTATEAGARAVHETAYLLGAGFVADGANAAFSYELGIAGVSYSNGAITAKVKLMINDGGKTGDINGKVAIFVNGTEIGTATVGTFVDGVATASVPYTLGSTPARLTARIVAR